MSGHARRMMARRERLLGPNNAHFYDDPVHFVRAKGVWLYDHKGRKYLDCYNNVPHVGHCHPHVVEAIRRQTGLLNTHSRYLHDNVLDYAERLTATFHKSLNTMLYTCTGSEANDVALRMAQSATGNRGLIVTDFTYHGNTALVMELATLLPREDGQSLFLRSIPAPDSYHRERGERTIEEMAARILRHLEAAIASLKAAGHGVAAILICPIFANEGFPDLPAGFLARIARKIHKAGGLVIADEVQAGFGRTGTAMWGHQHSGFTPDIVTMGKPMGNGYPIGGVVARDDIMREFRSKNLYFNTFGANPVACAAALATLDVIERERLIDNAREVGAYAKMRFHKLSGRFEEIGDIRGSGLFFGGEFVKSRKSRQADEKRARAVMNRMREEGVIMGLIGRKNNLLKIRPPMPFSRKNADHLFSTLQYVLERM
ncbi:MAG: aspartate aminotransferase family protein [Pseudomonadota bacterium]|nr:aspartate aminotransferase family protein [Pseudomonadota bacterium]